MSAMMRLLYMMALTLVSHVVVHGQQQYDKTACDPGPHDIPNVSPTDPDTDVAPDTFYVEWLTTASDDTTIVLEVVREWSPNGADRFYKLVQDNYYNCAAFFRIVPDFVVQFGIASQPNQTEKWETKIQDDPVLQSNVYGYVSFATSGPDTRTSQIFINTDDNADLDDQGFSPFAKVIQGMDVVEMLYNPTPFKSGGMDQTSLSQMGNAWLLQEMPDVDLIKSTQFGTEKPGSAQPATAEGSAGRSSSTSATCLWVSRMVLSVSGTAAVIAVVLL